MSLLIIHRSFSDNRRYALISALGVAASDTTYAIIAGLSISVIIDFIVSFQNVFKLIGGIAILLVGVCLFFQCRKKITPMKDGNLPNGSIKTILGMYLLTLTNPASLFMLGATFAGFGLIHANSSYGSLILLLIGVAGGTLIWWSFLTFMISRLKHKIKFDYFVWLNRIIGLILIGFGLFVLLSLLIGKLELSSF
jgi:threonine/homoserine/homoserine lactone efflux protein